jgi:hypothetical protein
MSTELSRIWYLDKAEMTQQIISDMRTVPKLLMSTQLTWIQRILITEHRKAALLLTRHIVRSLRDFGIKNRTTF